MLPIDAAASGETRPWSRRAGPDRALAALLIDVAAGDEMHRMDGFGVAFCDSFFFARSRHVLLCAILSLILTIIACL
jgi:hypothetical protein